MEPARVNVSKSFISRCPSHGSFFLNILVFSFARGMVVLLRYWSVVYHYRILLTLKGETFLVYF